MPITPRCSGTRHDGHFIYRHGIIDVQNYEEVQGITHNNFIVSETDPNIVLKIDFLQDDLHKQAQMTYKTPLKSRENVYTKLPKKPKRKSRAQKMYFLSPVTSNASCHCCDGCKSINKMSKTFKEEISLKYSSESPQGRLDYLYSACILEKTKKRKKYDGAFRLTSNSFYSNFVFV